MYETTGEKNLCSFDSLYQMGRFCYNEKRSYSAIMKSVVMDPGLKSRCLQALARGLADPNMSRPSHQP